MKATSATNGTPPVQAILNFDRTHPLDADQAKVNFVPILYNPSKCEANTSITQLEQYLQPGGPSFVAAEEEPGFRQLKTNHVLLGLNEAAEAMVLPQNGFCSEMVRLMLNQRQIGHIMIYTSVDNANDIATIPAIDGTLASQAAKNSNGIVRGVAVDSSWPNYTVAWAFDEDFPSLSAARTYSPP